MSCRGPYTTHEIVGSVRRPHKMNDIACRARWKMIVIDCVDGIERRDYYCTLCKVSLGENISAYRELERIRRKEGKYQWPRREGGE